MKMYMNETLNVFFLITYWQRRGGLVREGKGRNVKGQGREEKGIKGNGEVGN